MHKFWVIENCYDYPSYLKLAEKLLREHNFHLHFGGFSNKRVCIFVPEEEAKWLIENHELILDGPYEVQD